MSILKRKTEASDNYNLAHHPSDWSDGKLYDVKTDTLYEPRSEGGYNVIHDYDNPVAYFFGPVGPELGLAVKSVASAISQTSKLLSKWGLWEGKAVEKLPIFASRDLLESHFIKHGSEFKGAFVNADKYLNGAHDVINSGIKVAYQYKDETRIGYVRFMGNTTKTGEAKFEFVGTNNRGNITTYHVESGKDFWKMLNANSSIKNIVPYGYIEPKIEFTNIFRP